MPRALARDDPSVPPALRSPTDKAIIANRKLLAQAIDRVERGAAAPGLGAADFQGLIAIDTVVSSADWTNDWKTHDLARRADSDWAEDPWA